VVFRENEVLRLDETFALVELSVFRTVVRQLVAVEQPIQGDRAWVNDRGGPWNSQNPWIVRWQTRILFPLDILGLIAQYTLC